MLIIFSLVALLLPSLGLVVLHISAYDRSRALPLIAANSLLIIGIIFCLAVVKKWGMAKSAPVVAAAIVGLCVFQFWPKSTYVDTTKYSYPAISKFSAVQTGGMTFSKPIQFKSTAKKTDQNFSTESFAHLSPTGYPLGYIFTFSYKDSHTDDQVYVKGVNDFMDGAVKNDYRTQYIEGIKKQVFDSYPGYSAKLGEPQKFTNANIKKNAWSFDLDVTSSNPDIKPMKGKLVYVLGDGTIYYFSLMVTESNWASNMTTWQTVLSSLKL